MTKITDLKEDNIHQIRQCFYDGEIWTKNKLAQKTGLSLAATTNILQYLLQNNEILLDGKAQSTGGRKSKQYVLNADYQSLGVMILKRDHINYYYAGRIYNLLGKCLGDIRLTGTKGDYNELVRAIDLLLKKKHFDSLVISIPGVSNNGMINICDFEELAQRDLGGLLKDRYQLSIIIENDVNIAGIGFSRQYPQCNNLAFMYQPKVKYIGCSMIINHQLCKGFSNFAGELSYLPFFTHLQQTEMLKKAPDNLLLNQLVSLCCVVNPEIVGISSDVLEDFSGDGMENYLPKEHWPQIVFFEDCLDVLNKEEINFVLPFFSEKLATEYQKHIIAEHKILIDYLKFLLKGKVKNLKIEDCEKLKYKIFDVETKNYVPSEDIVDFVSLTNKVFYITQANSCCYLGKLVKNNEIHLLYKDTLPMHLLQNSLDEIFN